MTAVHKKPHEVDLRQLNFKEQLLIGTRALLSALSALSSVAALESAALSEDPPQAVMDATMAAAINTANAFFFIRVISPS